jgi:hypothetical protein
MKRHGPETEVGNQETGVAESVVLHFVPYAEGVGIQDGDAMKALDDSVPREMHVK